MIDLNRVDFVGRLETFDRDFAEVCERIGAPAVPTAPKNQTAPGGRDRQVSDELRELVAHDVPPRLPGLRLLSRAPGGGLTDGARTTTLQHHQATRGLRHRTTSGTRSDAITEVRSTSPRILSVLALVVLLAVVAYGFYA